MSGQWVVLKFGGSSVANPQHWQTIADVVNSVISEGDRPLLVLSALKNVSNQLEQLLHKALSNDYVDAIQSIQQRHLDFCNQLDIDLAPILDVYFDQLAADCQSIAQTQNILPEAHARVLAYGELLSSQIGVSYLNSQGIGSYWQDAREILISQPQNDEWHHFTSATCTYDYDAELSETLEKQEALIVTQGFIAADPARKTVLLGREGSDTSAAYIAAKLAAKRLEIWTDVAGVYTSNPREIKNAKPITELSFSQADQMANLGAKVLHPRAIEPAAAHNIPVSVKSTIEPEKPGTRIDKIASEDSVRTIGIVVEPLVSVLQTIKDNHKPRINAELLAKGFDVITQFKDDQFHWSILVYANSDVTQPSKNSITKSLLKDESFESNYGLISLIGNFDKQLIERVTKFVFEIHDQKPIKVFNENSGVISILSDSINALAICEALHHKFIE